LSDESQPTAFRNPFHRGRMVRLLPKWLRPAPPSNIAWITPALAVGGEVMLKQPKRLQELGVRAVLDLQAERSDRTESLAGLSLAYHKVAVPDFAAPEQEQLDEATAWVLERMQRDEPVLIHCRAGLGRSVTFAVATLMRIGYDLPAAYNTLRGVRAEIALSEAQLAALRLFAARRQERG
jgi:dual specificity MAP kinase phosphatase